jgi:hypothetical protein
MEKRRHKSSQMDEMASLSRRGKNFEEKHSFLYDIDRKERQQKNRVLDSHRSMETYNASRKVNADKENKKAPEMIRAKNYKKVSGRVAQHLVWCHESLFLLVYVQLFSSL